MVRDALIIIFAFAFGSMALLGFMAFSGDGGPAMGHCPFADNDPSMCPMTTLSHIQAWQSLFTIDTVLSFVALLLLVIGVAVLLGRPTIFKSPPLTESFVETESPPNFLSIAFASGVLHPKLYA